MSHHASNQLGIVGLKAYSQDISDYTTLLSLSLYLIDTKLIRDDTTLLTLLQLFFYLISEDGPQTRTLISIYPPKHVPSTKKP